MKNIGIIGAGMIGQALAKVLLQVGYNVILSNSSNNKKLYDIANNIGCKAGTQKEAIHFSNTIIVAIPFINYTTLPTDLLSHKIILDTMNYYPERDGHFYQLDCHEATTSELVAKHLLKSKVIKVFNAILAKDILKDAKPYDRSNRRAIPIAGDDIEAKTSIFKLLEQIGFDYVDAGRLTNSWKFERAKPAYCIPLNIEEMTIALNKASREYELPHNSWHNH